MIYRVCNFANLLGDFLGALGALDYLSRNNDVYFLLDELNDYRTGITIDAKHFFYPFIPLLKNDRIKILNPGDFYDAQIDIDAVRADHNYGIDNYMTVAYYKYISNQINNFNEIEIYPKAQFYFNEIKEKEKYDILLSPYGRSSSQNERISLNIWREFILKNNNYSFGILGQENSDDYSLFADLDNCNKVFNKDFNTLGNILSETKVVLSIVNGISHFCFHTHTKNILFTNQNKKWGNNPEAVVVRDYIPNISVNFLNNIFKKTLNI